MKLYKYKDKYPIVSVDSYIQDGVKICGDVVVEKDVSIWYNTTIRGDMSSIILKEGCNVQELSSIHSDHGFDVEIGKGSTVGHNCIIHGSIIKDNVLVGMGSTLLNGCEIGNNCLIGANSLVLQNAKFDDNTLIVGSPAKAIRKLSDDEISHIKENGVHYLNLAKEYKEGF